MGISLHKFALFPYLVLPIVKQNGNWWIGWIEEVPGVNCQEATYDEPMKSLKITLKEVLELNRQEALQAAESNFSEETVCI